MTVGRFAPSPSGRMHLGNVFTALLAWLSVRSQNGVMLLRIEDLDQARCKPEYITALREDLRWLGLDWDEEMPLQSTRDAAYAAAFARLPTYPCYCTRNALHDASAPHASDGQMIYSGICRTLTQAQRDAQTKAPAWRVAVPQRVITFQDKLCGVVSEELSSQCGDFIVRRADGGYAYQLAVVCDDAFGGVTEVVRGRDLLSSTARQLWLFEQLGYIAPQYCHAPLLIAPDGKRLSKRERALDMERLRLRLSPEALIGLLANAAGLTETDRPISAAELVKEFKMENIISKNILISSDFC